MADSDSDEFSFDDNDFDDLPANALHELEAGAIHNNEHTSQRPSIVNPPFKPPYNTFAQNSFRRQSKNDGSEFETGPAPHALSPDDYAEEVVDLNDEPVPLQSSNVYITNVQAFKSAQNANGSLYPHQRESQTRYGNHNEPSDAVELGEDLSQRTQPSVEQLLARIKHLGKENAKLNKTVQEERSKVRSKTGEVNNVRRQFEAQARRLEQEKAAMQATHNDLVVKQTTELEKIRREHQQAQTNNLFAEHDQAMDRARRTKKNIKDGTTKPRSGNASPAVTPRRQKSLPFRDGFDDDDIVMVSPSKTRDRSKAATPKLGGKRKRQIVDQSPIPALQLSESRPSTKPAEPPTSTDTTFEHAALKVLGKEDHRFKLLQRLVNQRCSNGQERVMEALTLHHFPSKPNERLSSIIYDKMSLCSLEEDRRSLALRFCRIFLSLWDQCLKEAYLAPLHLILDSLQFILAGEPSSTAINLTERLTALILITIDLVALPIVKAALDPSKVSARDSPDNLRLRNEINVEDCLDLLYVIATSCLPSSEAITCFWQNMQHEIVLMMLSKAQPLPQISLMLRILSTSCLSDSLGCIVPLESNSNQQSKREIEILDRLTTLLFETPEVLPNAESPDQAPSSYSQTELWTLRLQIISLLTAFSTTANGSVRLAHHRNVLGRLFRHLNDSITALYSCPLSPTHSLTIESINATMRLIHHLLTSNDVDIKSKLTAIPGAAHKYLVSLTRLAFSNGLVFEEGIEEAVIDAAHEILDAGISPEEGKELTAVFSSTGTAQQAEDLPEEEVALSGSTDALYHS